MQVKVRPAVGAAGEYGAERGAYPAQHHSTPCPPARQGPAHGVIRGHVWHKTARASVHMLRVPEGWAVALDDLYAAERAGAELLCILDSETGKSYLAALDTIRRFGLPIDRGFGAQIALPLPRWYCFPRETAPALQLRLFGEGAHD